MKILVLNGSPHVNGATVHMVNAFVDGARESGHDVKVISVAHKKIGGCLGCEYCHGKGHGECVQKDDMGEICHAILESDMVVFASPIYYFGFSAQLQAAIHRTYSFGIPRNVKNVHFVFGSGLVGAYELESHKAKYPRIVIDEKLSPSSILMGISQDDENISYFDYLALTYAKAFHSDSTKEDQDCFMALLDEHKNAIINVLKKHKNDCDKTLEKYRWLKKYHNEFCENRGFDEHLIE